MQGFLGERIDVNEPLALCVDAVTERIEQLQLLKQATIFRHAPQVPKKASEWAQIGPGFGKGSGIPIRYLPCFPVGSKK